MRDFAEAVQLVCQYSHGSNGLVRACKPYANAAIETVVQHVHANHGGRVSIMPAGYKLYDVTTVCIHLSGMKHPHAGADKLDTNSGPLYVHISWSGK